MFKLTSTITNYISLNQVALSPTAEKVRQIIVWFQLTVITRKVIETDFMQNTQVHIGCG